jgi:hypothetical protein
MATYSSSDNHVHNVAVVGAGGTMGRYIVEALARTGKHRVMAITRADSKSTMPSGLVADVKKVDYDDAASLIEALRGQDVLIITLKVTAPKDTQTKLVDAAAAAGVPWILPNEWGVSGEDESLRKDSFLGEDALQLRKYIESKGVSAWIAVTCGFWYEFSLSGAPMRYGFDFQNKQVTFFDDGNTKINHSTWPQVGRAVAGLLSLPVTGTAGGPCLDQFRNRYCYISSFCASQKDIFDSVLRVTGTTEADWEIRYQDVKERYKQGLEVMKGQGDNHWTGFVQVLYSRVFYPDGSGNHEAKHGLQNDVLGLPKEDFDEATKLAIKMDHDDWHGFRGNMKGRVQEFQSYSESHKV